MVFTLLIEVLINLSPGHFPNCRPRCSAVVINSDCRRQIAVSGGDDGMTPWLLAEATNGMAEKRV